MIDRRGKVLNSVLDVKCIWPSYVLDHILFGRMNVGRRLDYWLLSRGGLWGFGQTPGGG